MEMQIGSSHLVEQVGLLNFQWIILVGAADAVKLKIASKKLAELFKSFDRYFIELVGAAEAVKWRFYEGI